MKYVELKNKQAVLNDHDDLGDEWRDRYEFILYRTYSITIYFRLYVRWKRFGKNLNFSYEKILMAIIIKGDL